VRTSYVIQGRLARRNRESRRDEVRLDEAATEDGAREVARSFVTAGFTTWIFRVEDGHGTAPVYRLVTMTRPLRAERSPGVRRLQDGVAQSSTESRYR
jgi:hypothetical protein